MASRQQNVPSQGTIPSGFLSEFCPKCYTPLEEVIETFCPSCGEELPIQFSESMPE